MTESTYTVKGMACGHCAGFVTKELERLASVTGVAMDVDHDTVTVTSDRALDVVAVREAVEAAGYELAPAERK